MRDPIKDIDGWPCSCWWCKGELVWDSDADSGDIGEEPGRLVTFLHCKACGAEVLYKEPRKMLTYSAEPTDAMLTMTPMEVHIWNLLHSEGPMDAPGIVRSTRGDYFDIMQTIHSMAHRGLLKPQEDH